MNNIIFELAEGFLYAKAVAKLWDGLAERFGQSNGPLLFYIKGAMPEMSQGNQPIVIYYTKLKKCWDELTSLSKTRLCTCKGHKHSYVKKTQNQGHIAISEEP